MRLIIIPTIYTDSKFASSYYLMYLFQCMFEHFEIFPWTQQKILQKIFYRKSYKIQLHFVILAKDLVLESQNDSMKHGFTIINGKNR